MNSIQKRILLFLLGCMGARFGLTYLASRGAQNPKWISTALTLGAVTLGVGFWTIFLLGLRRTGPEVFGDVIWWDALRPVHGSLWLLFAALSWRGNPDAWIVLLADTVLGLVSFLWHHYSAGNFARL